MNTVLQIVLAATLGVGSCLAVSGPEFERVSDLPDHVPTVAGRMTLFADYDSISEDGQFPVFLVNLTSDYVEIGSQDGDFYLKLEAKIEDTWVRAQPHQFSWCGNSYIDRMMDPGVFVRLVGYQPAVGDPCPVRYSFYNQDFDLSSNVGVGTYSEADVLAAAWDEISVREGDFEHVSAIALGEAGALGADLWHLAVRALADERFEASQSVPVLRLVLERYPENRGPVVASLRKIERATR